MDIASNGTYRRVAIVPHEDAIDVWLEIGDESSTRHRAQTVFVKNMRVLPDSEGPIYLDGDSDAIRVVARDDEVHDETVPEDVPNGEI